MKSGNETRNIIIGVVIGVVCFLMIVLSGLFFLYYWQHKQISQLVNLEMTPDSESVGKDASGQNEAVQDNVRLGAAPAVEGSNVNEELYYQLSAAEKELDAAHKQLSDETAQKAENARNIEMKKKMLQDPANQKILRNAYKGQLDTIYGSLYSKLNLSPEKRDQLKELLTDQMMSTMELSIDMLGSTPSEKEKNESRQQSEDLKNKYDAKISALLGSQDFNVYETYEDRLTERQTVEMFTESLSEGDKLTDAQKDSLIDLMYRERKDLYYQQGWDEDMTFPSEYNDEGISKTMDMVNRTYDRYLKSAGSTLLASQLEQFKAYLKDKSETTKLGMELTAQLYGGQTDTD